MEERKRTSRQYWDNLYRDHPLRAMAPHDKIREWIEKQLQPSDSGGSLLEIGCFPGTYSAVFADLGYELNGVDWAARTSELEPWFASRGYCVGRFVKDDFFNFQTDRKYDVVASFGFIEHFTAWEDVVERHIALVAEGGHLVLEVPNFFGALQRWTHRVLDRESYERHHVPAMDVAKWARIAQERGLEVRFLGYFGGFDFWTEPQDRNMLSRVGVRLLRKAADRLRHVDLPDHRVYSPFAGMIARRRRQRL